MIKDIKLKFGASPAAPPLSFPAGSITIFVGPNYSGKSKLIREIQWFIQQGRPDPDAVILDRITLDEFNEGNVEAAMEKVSRPPNPGESLQPENMIVGRLGSRQQIPRQLLRDALLGFSNAPDDHNFRNLSAQWYFAQNMTLLDGQGRISLTNDQPFGDLSQQPTTSLQLLFRDDDLRANVRRIVLDAFALNLVTDPTNAGSIRLRLSQRPPNDLDEERGLTKRAADFHNAAVLLSQASDGTRAFTGIIIEAMAGKPDLLMVDEPEAFLHPMLSYKLGLEVARQVKDQGKHLIASTHSSDFLMGCISSSVPVNVVRLTYRNGNATARLLPSAELFDIMKNPLLRSAGMLSALFYENVVLSEGDTDRAFYQEINLRLTKLGSGRGIPNALFINANGKDAIPVMMKPLRQLGIPVVGIYDIDFIKDGGAPATRRLTAAGVPTELLPTLGTARTTIKSALEAADPNYKRAGGLDVLAAGQRTAADAYVKQLADFGVFLVPIGEVEGWLRDFNIGGHAADWLVPMFERLGNEGADDYVVPAEDDIWRFMDGMTGWLQNPDRLGMM